MILRQYELLRMPAVTFQGIDIDLETVRSNVLHLCIGDVQYSFVRSKGVFYAFCDVLCFEPSSRLSVVSRAAQSEMLLIL